MSTAPLVNRYLAYMKGTLHRSPATVYTYGRRLAAFTAFIAPTPVTAVTVRDLNAFLSRPRLEAKLKGPMASDSTIGGDICVLRGFFGWLREIEELIPTDPSRKLVMPKKDEGTPHPVPQDVWRRLWFSDLDDGDRVALGLAYFCGFRRFEITGLRADQFTDELVTAVLRKGGKRTGGFRWRSCVALYEARLPDLVGNADELFVKPLARLRRQRAAAPALLPWAEQRKMEHASPYVHTPPHEGWIDPGIFNKRLDRITRRLGLPKVAPHDLRHSFCTNLCSKRGAVPVQVVSRLAGHSDIRITMRYVDVGTDPLAELLAADAAVQVNRWG